MSVSVSIVIPTLPARGPILRACLDWVYSYSKEIEFEIVLVSPTKVVYRDRSRWVEESKPLGMAAAMKLGIERSEGKYIVWSNDDCIPTKGWLSSMVAFLDKNPDVGIGVFPMIQRGVEILQHLSSESSLIYANFGCMNRELCLDLGGWSTDYYQYYSDPDIACRVYQHKMLVLPCPNASLLHLDVKDSVKSEGISRIYKDQAIYAHKWSKFIKDNYKLYGYGILPRPDVNYK